MYNDIPPQKKKPPLYDTKPCAQKGNTEIIFLVFFSGIYVGLKQTLNT